MILDLAVIVGIILVLLKGSQLIFLPRQAKRVQDFFEDLTLWLDDAGIDNIGARLSEEGIQKLLIISTWFGFSLITLGGRASVILVDFVLSSESLDEIAIPRLYIETFSSFSCLIFLIALWPWPIKRLMGWLTSVDNPRIIKRRGWLLFTMTIVAGFVIYIVIVFLIDLVFDLRGFFQYRIIEQIKLDEIAINTNVMMAFLFLVMSHMLTKLGSRESLVSIRVFLVLAKGIMWRIVLFQKGAVAALTLLATISLSIVKILLTN